MLRPFVSVALVATLGTLGSSASAQNPEPAPTEAAPTQPAPTQAAPAPTYPTQQGYAQPAYGQGYGGYPQGYPQNYPQGYPQGYGAAAPPLGPPPPPAPRPAACCRWSARVDPFDLIFRRLTFQGEVKIIGPLSIDLVGSWIFDSPYENIEEKGFAIGGNIGVYFLSGKAFQGMWIKAHARYESFDAKLSNSVDPKLTSTKALATGVFGGMIGSTTVFGRDGGFVISGGIGIGVASSGPVTLSVRGDEARGIAPEQTLLFDKLDKIRLLGNVGLGVAF